VSATKGKTCGGREANCARSPLTVRHSSFTVHCSPFTLLPFTVHRSPLTLYLTLLLTTACTGSLSPLSHKLQIGEEPYLLFSSTGEDGQGDLFASMAGGGPVFQVTFTRVDERLPVLGPDGSVVVFVRSRTRGDSTSAVVTVMNLINGAERKLSEAGAVVPGKMAWSPDGKRLYARTRAGVLASPAPPAAALFAPVSATESAAADSALAVIVGDPPFAEVVACPSDGLCLRTAGDTILPLDSEARSAARWTPDSVALLVGETWTVRPLAGGRSRTLRWTGAPASATDLTLFPGQQ
jgi:hypothetical protein